jgi:hypothetical protein
MDHRLLVLLIIAVVAAVFFRAMSHASINLPGKHVLEISAYDTLRDWSEY